MLVVMFVLAEVEKALYDDSGTCRWPSCVAKITSKEMLAK